jgi:hypothetical protein
MAAVDLIATGDQQNLNDEDADKIVQEFNHLLEKSKQLFNGLR